MACAANGPMEAARVVQSRMGSVVSTPVWANRRAWVWNDCTQGTSPIDIDAPHARGIWIKDEDNKSLVQIYHYSKKRAMDMAVKVQRLSAQQKEGKAKDE
ncbi:UNVERIFIED_CONTAM: hypothetical protein K2H54_055425 [Gekko kuhli]